MRQFLPFLLLGVLLPLPAPVCAKSRPNLVILLADDLGWGDVGFNGRKDWATPHLKRLASQGTVFKRWYAAAAVCAPSRAALLTGKYGIHNGVSSNGADLPSTQTTLAEVLKKNGYATGMFGKWHRGNTRAGQKPSHPLDRGFQEFVGHDNPRDALDHFPKMLVFGREKKRVKGYAETIFANQAITFIDRHQKEPFFLYVAFTCPHHRIEAPKEYIDMFKGKFQEKDPARPINAIYAASVARLDKEVGRILEAIDKRKLSDNTLVVFTSDQGATFEPYNEGASAYHDSNFPFRGHKRTLWEGGIRVPAVVRWPGNVPAGKVSSEIVHMTDVFPTFLHAAGVKQQPKVDGTNLLDVWQGKAKSPARTLFWEWRCEGSHQLAAMRGNMKLVITGTLSPELYNVARDPAERRNLAHDQFETADTLRTQLKEWLATETRESKTMIELANSKPKHPGKPNGSSEPRAELLREPQSETLPLPAPEK
jgi:arylsulfatase A-like enzyme